MPLALLLALLYGVHEGVDWFSNKRPQQKLQREGLALQREQMRSSEKATEMGYKEQRAMANEAYERAGKLRREDRADERQSRIFEISRDSADRQTAMMLSMIQSIQGANQNNTPSGVIPSIPSLIGR